MTAHRSVHAFVMAGGNGSRLHPLTTHRCKPALPFGGNFRVVDFVLANLWNSEVPRVTLLVQYLPEALVDHVRAAWSRPRTTGGPFVDVAWPGAGGFRGTADAVAQHLSRLDDSGAELALVFGADHAYRMDVRAMIDHHLAQGADVTVAALPAPLAEASSLGIAEVTADGRIHAFHEKPRNPPPMPHRPDHALASMGNYVFAADVLRSELQRARARGETDFGQHVLPRLIHSHRVFAYDFTGNRAGSVPRGAPPYWRDVGTIDAYFEAHMDTLGVAPRFELDDPRWPLRIVRETAAAPCALASDVSRSSLAAGAFVDGAHLDRVVVGRDVRVAPGAVLERCLLLGRATVGAGARLRGVIVDEDNDVPPGETIGWDAANDRDRFFVSERGVVVVPRGTFRRAAAAGGARPGARELSLHP